MGYRVVVRSTLDSPEPNPQGSFLSGLAKGVTHFVGGVAAGLVKGTTQFVKTGSPFQAIIGGVKGVYDYDVAHGVLPGKPAVSTAPPLAPMPMSPWGGGGFPVQPSMPGGATPTQNPWTGQPYLPATTNGAGPGMKGYHLNKSWSYRRKTGQLIAPHSTYVKNRHMNWANGRALTRAEARIGRFVKHAARYIRWVHPHRKGRPVPKFKKRSR